jgi:hypothetical protein
VIGIITQFRIQGDRTRTYGAGSDLNKASSLIAASNLAGRCDLFQPRMIGSQSLEIVYLRPSPDLRLRMMIIDIMMIIDMRPGGAFPLLPGFRMD